MPDATPIDSAATCPCRILSGERRSYANCCKPLHDAGFAGLGISPEATMRSRYCAYLAQDQDYLIATWHPSTRPATVDFSTDIEWHGLTVLSAAGSGLDREGSVEFKAKFRRGDAHLELHERSAFVQEGGRWFYVDGIDPDIA